MPAVNLERRSVALLFTLLGIVGPIVAVNAEADIYDDAVAHPGRPADDSRRDTIDHPAEVLRLSGIGPGMQVADILAAGGYNSELLSHIVGPSGHVLMLNNAATDNWSGNYWKTRLAPHPRLITWASCIC
jgi:predicted methyltransferase